jgi:ketosteroid isomerase-like protein
MESYDSDDVQTFLATFGVAVSTGDLDAIADTYAFPALVVDGTTSEVVPDPDTVRDAARRAARGYRERGLVAAAAHLEDVEEVGDALVWARVRWSYRDEWANEQESSTVRYLLRRARDTFEVCVEVRLDPREA